MVVLIFTIPGDFHTVAVKWGLKKLGVETVEFLTSDLPDRTSLLIELVSDRPSIVIDGRHLCLTDIGVVWNRRLERPQAPTWVHEDDWDVLERECFEFANNARHLLSAVVPTINPPGNQAVADRKALQLHVARQLGMNVRPTLIGNDFDLIQDFRSAQPTVHKPFRYHQWRGGDERRASFTAVTPKLDETARRSIESCPMIYQGLINAECDVRIVCFGKHQVACRIQKRPETASSSLDIRRLMREGATSASAIDIPTPLQDQLCRYMERLGLAYAAFDFMIDDVGTWWFLECNESGQFLFIEYLIPESRLLEKFCFHLAALAVGQGVETPAAAGDISIAAFEAEGGLDAVRAHHAAHKISKENLLLAPV